MTELAPPLTTRNETELARTDRHLAELMREVRVAQTGVQVLFGFLLTVPLTTRFGEVGAAERVMYLATAIFAGAAALVLIAPTSHHRVLFRCGDKAHLVRLANRYAIARLTCVGVSISGALAFVTALVFGGPAAGAIGGAVRAACLWCWYARPLIRRLTLFGDLRIRGSVDAT